MVAGRDTLSLTMQAISQAIRQWALSSSLSWISDTITVYLQLYSNLDLKLIDAFPMCSSLLCLPFCR